MKKITGKAQVISLERKREAVQLRKEGLTLAKIGQRLGVSVVMVHKYIKSELEAIREDTHEMAVMEREIALLRLESIIGISYKKAKEGDWKAASLMLKAMERQAKLLGLDAPTKHEPVKPELGTITPEELNQIRRQVWGYSGDD
ncbi:MAG: hypothetical protein OEZ32_11090 [Nitrospinota bacterium]|nr:hypothetical protein [Nitrospinota bacterium]